MERFWIDNNRALSTEIAPLEDVVFEAWRREAILVPGQTLIACAVDMLDADRRGDKIDATTLRGCVQILTQLSEEEATSRNIYVDNFERKVIQRTRAYYRREARRMSRISSVPNYVRAVARFCALEMERAQHFLPASSKLVLCDVVEKEMVLNQTRYLVADTARMLQESETEHLRLLHNLLCETHSDLEALVNAFSTFFAHLGAEVVNRFGQFPPEEEPEQSIDLINSFAELISQAKMFHRDALRSAQFGNALERTFRNIVNLPLPHRSIAGLLARHFDATLAPNRKCAPDAQQRDSISAGIEVFVFIDEKDAFHETYRSLLANRLLSDSSDFSLESDVLVALGLKAGQLFTSKLRGMLEDVEASSDLNARLEPLSEASSPHLGVEFSMKVLALHSWPLTAEPSIVLPRELAQYLDGFQRLYRDEAPQKRLQWSHSRSSVVLVVRLGRQFEITASAVQAAVLVQFNDDETISVSQVAERLHAEDSVVNAALETLSSGNCKGLLVQAKDRTYRVNTRFCPKASRLYPATPTTPDQPKETREVPRNKEMDYNVQIDAALVRTMKARRTLSEDDLVKEVTCLLGPTCKVDSSAIRGRVGGLVEREYLHPVSDNPAVFAYIP